MTSHLWLGLVVKRTRESRRDDRNALPQILHGALWVLNKGLRAGGCGLKLGVAFSVVPDGTCPVRAIWAQP
jgi:hypothetical protein